jgi:hypothetical protein
MSRKTGGKFTPWHREVDGRNLLIAPKKLIVQTWRGPIEVQVRREVRHSGSGQGAA